MMYFFFNSNVKIYTYNTKYSKAKADVSFFVKMDVTVSGYHDECTPIPVDNACLVF